jgi:hypothetical protein
MKTLFINFFRVALCGATTLLLTGCVGILPRPVSATKVEYGHRLLTNDVSFIQSGVTTRAEVIARLGTNYTALPLQRALAYSWEMQGGGWVWWLVLVGPNGGGGTGGQWTGGWKAFFIAFDDQGVVTSTAFKSPSTRRSLHDHMYNWLASLPAKPAAGSGKRDAPKPTPMLAGAREDAIRRQ